NATLSDSVGLNTILNDDAVPSLSINNVSQNEGNTGTSLWTFTVTLSNQSNQTVTVDYATANGTATAADSDYLPTAGTLTFSAGETQHTIAVPVRGDTKFEANETFVVNLFNSVNSSITGSQGTGTILNDDSAPGISIGNTSAAEGN